MEQEFLNVGLDIIGLGVFNYDFSSITTQSPVIKVPLWHGSRQVPCGKLHMRLLPCRGQLWLGACTHQAAWLECDIWQRRQDEAGCSVQAVYGVLKEAEHRSTFYIPYWKLPLAAALVPRQRRFREDISVINACLDDLIAQAKRTRTAEDAEALQARDYSKVGPADRLACQTPARWLSAACARRCSRSAAQPAACPRARLMPAPNSRPAQVSDGLS